MTNTTDAIKNVMDMCANYYSHNSTNPEMSENILSDLIKNMKTELLIEDNFADIGVYSTIIHKEFREILNLYCLKTPYGYNSKDPSFKIIGTDGVYVISYTYDNNIYNSFPMSTYNVDIISNYALLHDILFCLILKTY